MSDQGKVKFEKMFHWAIGKGELRMAMVGLAGAGKTTITSKIPLGEPMRIFLESDLLLEIQEEQNVKLATFNLNDNCRKYKVWNHYLDDIRVIILVVDSDDRAKIPEVRYELSILLNEESLREAVFLVLANKQDVPNTMTPAELTSELGLNEIKDRKWFVQATCGTTAEGLEEGVLWLSEQLTHKK